MLIDFNAILRNKDIRDKDIGVSSVGKVKVFSTKGTAFFTK